MTDIYRRRMEACQPLGRPEEVRKVAVGRSQAFHDAERL